MTAFETGGETKEQHLKRIKRLLKVKLVDRHTFYCSTCREMAKRGYKSEVKYWDDLFNKKLKSIKYKLVLKK